MKLWKATIAVLLVAVTTAGVNNACAGAMGPAFHEMAHLLGQPLSVQQTAEAQSAEGGAQQLHQDTSTTILGHTVNLITINLQTQPAGNATPTPDPSATPDVGGTAVGSTVTDIEGSFTFENGTPKGIGTGGGFGGVLGAIGDAVANAPEVAPTPAQGVVLNQHDLYIGGVRVWNGALRYDQGSLVYSGGVAPTQVPIPIFAYPLGPVLLQVEAGVEFEGNVSVKITPGVSYPLTDSSVTADLQAKLYAAGYIDAYARLLFLRAGVEGRINVIDAVAGWYSTFFLTGMKPISTSYGYARLLSGSVNGFVDFNLIFGRWRRLINKSFFSWKGKCLDFTGGDLSCAN
ncbi:MAG: hypothetical protein JST80_04000 [Bdellovibrionales bacterium]|nr:hypothetical protein [Bdellovibrionales bacterium]